MLSLEAPQVVTASSGEIASSSRPAVSGKNNIMMIGTASQNSVRYRIAIQCDPVVRYSTPSRKKPSAPPVVPVTARTLPAVERYEVGNNSAPYAAPMVLEATSQKTWMIQIGMTALNEV